MRARAETNSCHPPRRKRPSWTGVQRREVTCFRLFYSETSGVRANSRARNVSVGSNPVFQDAEVLFWHLQRDLEWFIERVSELLDAESTPGRTGRTSHQWNESQHSIYPGHHHPLPEAGSATRGVEGLGPVIRRLDRVSTCLVERMDLDRRMRDRSSPNAGSGLPYEPAARRACRTGSCFCSIAATPSLSRPSGASFGVPPDSRAEPSSSMNPP